MNEREPFVLSVQKLLAMGDEQQFYIFPLLFGLALGFGGFGDFETLNNITPRRMVGWRAAREISANG